MQNAGQQYGQGGASSHPGAPYGQTESSSNSGSITSSLRQFRKKDVEKQQINDTNTAAAESHVARVAPHNHYPPRPTECYRYPSQFQDYSLPSQVKYSEISDPQPLQEHLPPTVIQKAKGKDYMDMCNVQQPHMKQPYSDHLNGQQSYPPETNIHAHAQYLQKDQQVHPPYKPESQYFPKEPQYQQLPQHQIPKYNMPAQVRKCPTENDFLSKLRRIHPNMARSIMSDHHLQESQPSYQAMDQNRMYHPQNPRYMNYPSSMQGNPYPPSYMPPQHYTNYPSSCSYTRPSQMGPRFPTINSHERSLSPRRGYSDNLPMPPMNYTTLPQKISPNYPQYNSPEYAQHYQHRRPALPPQDYYQQHCRTSQYLPHQMPSQDMSENRVTVSDSIKQYIENWADEETASEMNQIENNRLCKENFRVRDDQSTETVYMINASELQYLENGINGIPLVTSENGIPLVASENGQYIIKSGVAIDSSTGMVRIVDKSNHLEPAENNVDRVVNLHIMDPLKPDCMLASKSNELNQKQNDSLYNSDDKPKVVIHQNTIIHPGKHNMPKEPDETSQIHNKIGNSLPLITDSDASLLDKFDETIFKECKKETVDKNCSPINVEQMEKFEEFQENATVICPTRAPEPTESLIKEDEKPSENSNDLKLKNMPIIDMLTEEVHDTVDKPKCDAEELAANESVCKVKDEKMIDNSEDGEKIAAINEHTNEDVKSNVETPHEEKTIAECEKMDTIESNADTNTNTNKNEYSEIETIVKEETEENPKKSEDIPQTTNDSEIEFTKREESLEKEVQEPQIEHPPSSEVIENKVEQTGETEKPVDIKSDIISKSQNTETLIDEEKITNNDNEKKADSIVISDGIEKNADDSISDKATNSASENVSKPTIKRSRRIFSVDDIINNIGNKSKAEKERAERRRSLQMTREFLEKEIDHSYTFLQKLEAKEIVIKEFRALNEEEENKNIPREDTAENYENDKQLTEEGEQNCDEETTSITHNTEVDESKEETSVGVSNVKSTNNVNESITEDTSVEISSVKSTNDVDENITEDKIHFETEEKHPTDDCEEPSAENTSEEFICNKDSPEVVSELEIPSNINEESTLDNSEAEAGSVLSFKEAEVGIVNQNEVHYRNAIRIEESNVLLQIAGELVEINVNTVNGKKVITVVPLSESTIVDFNDNYELLEHVEVNDPLKTDLVAETVPAMEIADIEEVIPQPDIETTSEIIIGMDISLEEEIQLDLEKPQVLCTKAAKKAYENDLQIPSITTSEDINDNNKTESYSPNDKVSSSKEQSPKDKSDKKKSVKTDSSKKKDTIVKRPKCSPEKELDPEKKALRELMRVRKLKKEKVHQKSVEEEEEFVPFKDLVKARKLKKLKLQQSKANENVGADSTNKVDQEENNESASESKPKKSDSKDEGEEHRKDIATENKDAASKGKEHKPKTSSKSPKAETGIVEITETLKSTKDIKDEIKIENKRSKGAPKEDNSVNSATLEKKTVVTDKVKEKGAKKVTFGPVNYCDQQKSEIPSTEIRNFILQDPRIKSKPNGDIMVPSVSEILKENERLESSKKRLSLEEYNKRKRKLSVNSDGGDKEAKFRKITLEDNASDHTKLTKTNEQGKARQTDEARALQEKADRVKMPRPKSLDDLKLLAKPRDILAKRKLSLEVTGYKPNYFDWEETQSPKTNLNSHENNDKHLSEFSGLINHNKSKIVIDINDLNAKPTPSDNSEDEILQNYKEQVDSKLSSLNIQIPRAAKLPTNVFNPFSKPETNNLMQRFLQNEKITYEEMEKIKKIISYKRLVQQLKKIKSPTLASLPLSPSYEIRRNCAAEKEMKLHLKKVPGKKSKERFRNLYSQSTSESDSDFSEVKKNDGDYSVVQSNCFAAGVPKLIIKRKTEMPVPVVRLERLDLDLLVNKKRKIY